MDSLGYLKKYGWKEGEALKEGGLKRPILVSHKYDYKGVGQNSNDGVAWWERLFDGQLKALDVNGGGIDQVAAGRKTTGIPTMFNPNASKVKASEIDKSESPLYRMFVFGEILQGTVGMKAGPPTKRNESRSQQSTKTDISLSSSDDRLVIFDVPSDDEDKHKHKHHKKHKSTQKKEHKHKHEHKRKNLNSEKQLTKHSKDHKHNDSHDHRPINKHNHKRNHKHNSNRAKEIKHKAETDVPIQSRDGSVSLNGNDIIGTHELVNSDHHNADSSKSRQKKRRHSHKDRDNRNGDSHKAKKQKM